MLALHLSVVALHLIELSSEEADAGVLALERGQCSVNEQRVLPGFRLGDACATLHIVGSHALGGLALRG